MWYRIDLKYLTYLFTTFWKSCKKIWLLYIYDRIYILIIYTTNFLLKRVQLSDILQTKLCWHTKKYSLTKFCKKIPIVKKMANNVRKTLYVIVSKIKGILIKISSCGFHVLSVSQKMWHISEFIKNQYLTRV